MPSEFVKEVADVFAKDGPLSKVTANYTPRPSQIEFATSVAEALEQGKSLVAEAGTGTGKTFAYLVPALDFNRWQDASRSAIYERHSGAFKSAGNGLSRGAP